MNHEYIWIAHKMHFFVKSYLGIKIKKLVTNGEDHKVMADKCTPR